MSPAEWFGRRTNHVLLWGGELDGTPKKPLEIEGSSTLLWPSEGQKEIPEDQNVNRQARNPKGYFAEEPP